MRAYAKADTFADKMAIKAAAENPSEMASKYKSLRVLLARVFN